MRRLGIIQPGKIGDIIICLPIAKWYADRGYEVIWPVDKNILVNFLGYIDYVKFVPIDFNCVLAHQVCFTYNCNTVLDLAFSIPGANQHNTDSYLKQNDFSFDEYKYYLANVPFEEKWNLSFERNLANEDKVLESLGTDNFVLVQENSSDYKRHLHFQDNDVKRVDINYNFNSVLDWVGALEKAEQLILIESCFSNLVDQLKIQSNQNILLLKHGYYGDSTKDGRLKGLPILKCDWKKL